MTRFHVIILLFQAFIVAVAPYKVTSYIEVEVSVVTGLTLSYATELGFTDPGTTISSTYFISPTISAVPTGLSTITTTDEYYSYLSVVEIFVPSGVGSTITEEDLTTTPLVTDFYVPVTYEPFSTCSGKKWMFVATIPIDVPLPAQPYITPLAISTSTTAYTETESTTTETDRYTRVSALINPTDVPPDQYSSASSSYQPPGVTLCTEPAKTSTLTPHGTSAHTATGTASVEGITCGKSNPTCEDCTYYTEYCIGDCPSVEGEYYECDDGKKYYKKSDGTKQINLNKLVLAIVLPAIWGALWFFFGM